MRALALLALVLGACTSTGKFVRLPGVEGRGSAVYRCLDELADAPPETQAEACTLVGTSERAGRIDAELLGAHLVRHHDELLECNARPLGKRPSDGGVVTASWVIGPWGTVLDAVIVDSELRDAEVERCVLARIREWRFPRPEERGLVVVTQPWLFPPREAEPPWRRVPPEEPIGYRPPKPPAPPPP